MNPLSRFTELWPIGLSSNQYEKSSTAITEKVVVCPSCRNIHSLRYENDMVKCSLCSFTAEVRKHYEAA